MKNMKKILVLLLAILTITASVIPSFAAAVPETAEANASETVEIAFTYENVPGISGTFEFSNPDFVKEYTITSDPVAACNETAYAWFNQNGEAVTVTITVKVTLADDVQPGDSCDVTFTYEVSDKDGKLPEIPDYKTDTATIVVPVPADEIDYTELDFQINRTKALEEGDYTVESWEDMEDALAIAEAVRVQDPVTQKEVDAAALALKEAIDGLDLKPVVTPLDYTELDKQIEIATGLKDHSAEYTEDSFNYMLDCLNKALNVREAATTQDEIDVATKLLADAIAALVKVGAPVEIDYTELNDQIKIALDLNPDDYTPESWSKVEEALAAAIAARDSQVQSEVDKAAAALAAAIEGLVRKTVAPAIDYAELEKQIARAEALDEKKYSPASWENMQKALAAAIEARNATVQSEVDAAAAALKAAIDALVPATSDNVLYPLWIAIGCCVFAAITIEVIHLRKKSEQ